MKTIKNGLVALALSAGISGCATTSLIELSNREIPHETAKIDVNAGGFTTAEVKMNVFIYEIICDDHHYFIGSANLGRLTWGNVTYEDTNMDGNVEQIEVDYRYHLPVPGRGHRLEERYDSILRQLKQQQIYDIWAERWLP